MPNSPLFYGSIMTVRLGRIWAAVSKHGLVAVDFGITRARFAAALHRQTKSDPTYAPLRLRKVTRQIGEYLAGRRRHFDLSIDWFSLASDFQRRSLRAVFSIPYGQTRTYAEIAREIGYPRATRAVGRANATNPMPLVIPCHRVIGSDGRLHGYGGAGGLRTKAWLIAMERGHQ